MRGLSCPGDDRSFPSWTTYFRGTIIAAASSEITASYIPFRCYVVVVVVVVVVVCEALFSHLLSGHLSCKSIALVLLGDFMPPFHPPHSLLDYAFFSSMLHARLSAPAPAPTAARP